MSEGQDSNVFSQFTNWCLRNRLVVLLFTAIFALQGIVHAPFDWTVPFLGSDPVPVDAMPDVADNQQIVFTEWPGYSPEDVDEQITYPLTLALQGLPSVKAMRASSMFGFSSITIIFEDDVDFYWSRSRLLEKLSSLSPQTLPAGVTPKIGPDATGLGQIFWYTLEGRTEDGEVVNAWDLEELRNIQEWDARLRLQSVPGVAEVASIGGYEREYQIDIDPQALQAANISILDVVRAVQASNRDVGARSIEQNDVEYVIRSRGLVENEEDLESIVLAVRENVPLLLSDVARVSLGPALRRGALDKEGAPAVGGVVVVQQNADPYLVSKRIGALVSKEINRTGLAQKTLSDGRVARLHIVPFYDRSVLIEETVDTLKQALSAQILISIIVIVLMMRIGPGILISSLLPVSVLMSFVIMRVVGIEANILSLSGIAIAIGTVVDMGIVICESIVSYIERYPEEKLMTNVRRACAEVASAIVTAVATTIVGFIPVFFLAGEAGRMFSPLAATKTIILFIAVVLALSALPVLAGLFFKRQFPEQKYRYLRYGVIGVLLVVLSMLWSPYGPAQTFLNIILTVVLVLGIVFGFIWFRQQYEQMLRWCLQHKVLFLSCPLMIVVLAACSIPWLGEEPMPPLEEGSFLLMPTMSYHGSIGEALEIISQQDKAISAIPEIETVVGKIGRVQSALDPAPVGMVETLIQYKPEWKQVDGKLVRQWREHIQTPNDIWDEIAHAAQVPGVTGAPKLQPIETRRIMLQTGLRAPCGLKVLAADSEVAGEMAIELEKWLKKRSTVQPSTVIADRVVAKPYLEIVPDRQAMARHGLHMKAVQDVIEVAVGGKVISQVLDGNARHGIRVRYPQNLRDDLDSLRQLLVPTPMGYEVLLEQVATISMEPGPQVLKREGTDLVAYVTFSGKPDIPLVDFIAGLEKELEHDLQSGVLQLPAQTRLALVLDGKSLDTYRQQEAQHRRVFIISGLVIALILFLQFKNAALTAFVASSILVALSGAVLLITLYNQDWLWQQVPFVWLADFFNIGTLNISTAVLVGFIALFGIATDDAVVMATYLRQEFEANVCTTTADIHHTTVDAALRRIRPCLMTSATTIVSLLPVLSSAGRGSDVMRPMAVPIVGGMIIVLLSVFMLPVCYAWYQERQLRKHGQSEVE